MLHLGLVSLLIGLLVLEGVSAQTQTVPFWKKKAKVYDRVKEGEVIVSVRTEPVEASDSSNQLELQGGGIVRAPRRFVFSRSQRFEDLPQATGYVKSARYSEETRHLEVQIEAYGYSTKTVLQIDPSSTSEPWHFRYRVIEGPMKGMWGQLKFVSTDKGQTEVGLEGTYEYQAFPIPRFFLTFGMEAVLKFMAVRLRQFLEKEYRASTDQPFTP